MALLGTSHVLLNSKGRRLRADHGWMANRYEYLGSLFHCCLVSFVVFFTTGSKVDVLLLIKGIFRLTSVPYHSAPDRMILGVSSTLVKSYFYVSVVQN